MRSRSRSSLTAGTAPGGGWRRGGAAGLAAAVRVDARAGGLASVVWRPPPVERGRRGRRRHRAVAAVERGAAYRRRWPRSWRRRCGRRRRRRHHGRRRWRARRRARLESLLTIDDKVGRLWGAYGGTLAPPGQPAGIARGGAASRSAAQLLATGEAHGRMTRPATAGGRSVRAVGGGHTTKAAGGGGVAAGGRPLGRSASSSSVLILGEARRPAAQPCRHAATHLPHARAGQHAHHAVAPRLRGRAERRPSPDNHERALDGGGGARRPLSPAVRPAAALAADERGLLVRGALCRRDGRRAPPKRLLRSMTAYGVGALQTRASVTCLYRYGVGA